jgi:hypothetical protein
VLHVICFVREDLAHRLQKYGPIFFKSLTENKILQLVKLLIAKKWLEESLVFGLYDDMYLYYSIHVSLFNEQQQKQYIRNYYKYCPGGKPLASISF